MRAPGNRAPACNPIGEGRAANQRAQEQPFNPPPRVSRTPTTPGTAANHRTAHHTRNHTPGAVQPIEHAPNHRAAKQERTPPGTANLQTAHTLTKPRGITPGAPERIEGNQEHATGIKQSSNPVGIERARKQPSNPAAKRAPANHQTRSARQSIAPSDSYQQPTKGAAHPHRVTPRTRKQSNQPATTRISSHAGATPGTPRESPPAPATPGTPENQTATGTSSQPRENKSSRSIHARA